MTKVVGVASVLIFLASPLAQRDRLANYTAVEAFEVRPGILALPSYADDGEFCEVGLERRHYSPGIVRLEAGLDRKEVNEVVDELAPPTERGAKLKEMDGITLVAGPGGATIYRYENVTVEIYTKEKSGEDVAAVIKWTYRKCKDSAARGS